MFAYVGTHFVSITHPFICKKFMFEYKMFNVNINIRKPMITFLRSLFRFQADLAALILLYSEYLCKMNKRSLLLKIFFDTLSIVDTLLVKSI